MAATNTNANPIEVSKARLAELQDGFNTKLDALKRTSAQRADIAIGTLRDRGLDLVYSTSAAAVDGAATVGRVLPFATELAKRLEHRAERLTERGAALNAPRIEDYDELNVKQVCEALDGLGAWELSKVRRYEEEHKNRKTVLGAIERLLR